MIPPSSAQSPPTETQRILREIALQSVLGVLAFGLIGTAAILGLQLLRFPEVLPVSTAILAPVPLAVITAYHTHKRPIKYAGVARFFMAGTSYFSWFTLISLAAQAHTGTVLPAALSGTVCILLAVIPFFTFKLYKERP